MNKKTKPTRVFSIEKFHATIDDHIRVVKVYMGFKGLDWIITTCRLKPYEYLLGDVDKGIYKWWVDEFGHSLFLYDTRDKHGKKQVKLLYNDLNIQTQILDQTDLYYGLSLDRVQKMSKLGFIMTGTDELDLWQKFRLVSFLGLDNHWRTYAYQNNQWQQVSTLFLGIKTLRDIYTHRKIGKEKIEDWWSLQKTKDCFTPCQKTGAWLYCVPMSQNFRNELKKYDEQLAEILL